VLILDRARTAAPRLTGVGRSGHVTIAYDVRRHLSNG
jgi:hypothetical protein